MSLYLRRGESPAATTVTVGDLTLVFSYETVVAFEVSGYGWVVSENVWSKTTGKHINQEAPRGIERTSYERFKRALDYVVDDVRPINRPARVKRLDKILGRS
jgi:hypothetical protein